MPDLVGSTIGQYEIVGRLGRGGMATVYKGYQAPLDRYVAIKVLDAAVSSEELFLARFQREARAVALLRHPHIVQIYDFGNVDDMYYMVMEYVDGQSLRDRLKSAAAENKYMTPEDVLAVVWGISSALDYAYQRGIIHRDIKPGNILLSSEGQAVLSDFGIAQMITSSRLTLSGLVGTPNYMSPEQGQGLEIDQRTDIYSLGIVTYEMLTNHVPFSSDTPFAVVMAHVTRPLPSLVQARRDIPSGVEDVLVKATAKEKEKRYYRAMEFAENLETAFSPMLETDSVLDDVPLVCVRCHAPLEPGQRFCGKCGAHVGTIPVGSSEDGASPMTPVRRNRLESVISPMNSSAAGRRSPAASSETGSAIAGHPLTLPEAASPVSFPRVDESSSRGRSWTVTGALIGLLIVLLILGIGIGLPQLQGDGQQAAIGQRVTSASTLIGVTSASTEVLADDSATPSIPASTEMPLSASAPAASSMVVATRSATRTSAGVAAETPAEGFAGTPAVPPEVTSTQKSGSDAFVMTPLSIPSESPVTRAPADTRTGSPIEPPKNLTVDTPTATVYIGIIVSPTVSLGANSTSAPVSVPAISTPEPLLGQIIFKTDRDGRESTYIMHADGSNQRPLRDLDVYQKAVAREPLSPDGTERLRVQDNSGSWDIYMGPADEHKPPMAITSHAAADYDPVWSPAENLIAFVSLRSDGKDAIFVMTPDGRNDRQITFARNALDKHPSWSLDGSKIAFGSNRDGNRQIYVMNKDGSSQTNISSNSYNDWDPIWIK